MQIGTNAHSDFFLRQFLSVFSTLFSTSRARIPRHIPGTRKAHAHANIETGARIRADM